MKALAEQINELDGVKSMDGSSAWAA